MSQRNSKGFTLVEIIVAIALLAIMAVVFLPIMTMSYSHIVKTGKKSQKLYEAQNIMEISIVDEEVFKAAKIPIKQKDKASDTTVFIKGGIVEADKLQTFLPWVPAMSLEPDNVVEGYENEKISIIGVNTNFKSGSRITITNDKGYSNDTIIKTLKSETEYEITLPTGINRLKNSGSEYIITIETEDEIAKSKLNIRLPRFLRANNSIINVSKDAAKAGETALSDAGNINGLFWTGNRFFALGKNKTDDRGIIHILEEGEDWQKYVISDSKTLNALVYDGNRFVAVGDEGHILYSSNGVNWNKVSSPNMPSLDDIDIKSITWGSVADIDGTSKDLFIAVGTKGTILTSSKGDIWTKIGPEKIPSGDNDLNSVIWGVVIVEEIPKDIIAAVGQDGTIIVSEDGENWVDMSLADGKNLNSILYNDNEFVVIGDSATIITSNTGTAWNKINTSDTDYNDKNLYDICWGPITDEEDGYIVAGEGITLTKTNGNDWAKKNTNTFHNITSRK